MHPKIARFLSKHSILQEDIKYIIRENGETVVCTIDGRSISTYHPVKEFREALPVEEFLCPNKGIIIAASQIVGVKDGYYETADGRRFKYRVHNSQLHDSRLLMLGRQFEHALPAPSRRNSADLASHFTVFDKMPLPVCVLELDMATDSFSAEFVLRYCNQASLEFAGVERGVAEDQNLSRFFPAMDPKWQVVFMDVALNDSIRSIVHYDKARDLFLKVHCYQPMQGYCACVLTQIESKDAQEAVRYVSELNTTRT